MHARLGHPAQSPRSRGLRQRLDPELPLVGAHPLADRVVGHPVPAPDSQVARLLDLPRELLVRRPLDRARGKLGPDARLRSTAASMRAESLIASLRYEALAATAARPRAVHVLAAVRIERRCAVR